MANPDTLSPEACTALLLPVAVALGCQVDKATLRAYYRALRDVPPGLLQQACELAVRAPRAPYEPRFPTAPTLRLWAEQARQAWLTAHPWEPCEGCQEGTGFVEFTDAQGVLRLQRCVCWKAYQQRIAAAGMTQRLALSPAPAPAREELEA